MITNLVHRNTGFFLSIEDAWFEANDVLFLENWWLCECDKPNPNTSHTCNSCGAVKDGMPDVRLEDMWGLLGKVYDYDLALLKQSDDFVVVAQSPDEICKTAPVSRVLSNSVGDESWEVSVYFNAKKLWGDGSWLGVFYNLKIRDDAVIDLYKGKINAWPNHDVAGALNYLLGVNLPVDA